MKPGTEALPKINLLFVIYASVIFVDMYVFYEKENFRD